MSNNLKFEVDVERLSNYLGGLKEEVTKDIKQSTENLAVMTHAKVLELATQELGSLQKMFKDNVEFSNPMEGFWIVTLKKPAVWIDEGRKCVVYGKNKDHVPLILTPDGEIPITKLKKGMLVLNQYGKWVKVVEIYDEHLVEKSKLTWDRVEVCNYMPENNKKHKRIKLLHMVGTCPVCSHVQLISKFNKKDFDRGIYCKKCFEKESVYKVEISGSLNKKSKNWSTMFLTGDHKVMTQNGWKEIRLVKDTDSIKVPSWSNCKYCKKPTLFGKDFCYDNKGGKCSGAYTVRKTLKAGKHQCQQLDSRAKYLERLQKLQKHNKTEERVSDFIKLLGYSCNSWSDKVNTDFIREFPIRVTSNGKNKFKTFFADFYCKKLNLIIEIDGKSFHTEKRDSIRDSEIKKILKCDIIRIPAKQVWKKDFLETTLIPIIKNHSGKISMMDFHSFKISKVKMNYYSSIKRRWDITVESGESFVCNKMLIHNSGFMEELLHGKSSKEGKNGRYAVIPFEHSKAPSEQSPKAYDLAKEIQYALKKKGINWKKIETNSDGSPRLGRLHAFDLETARPTAQKEIHKNSLTKGVAIYQSKKEDGSVKRDVMTFRVITEKHRGEGLWFHPGRQGNKIMEKSLDWCLKVWEKEILPALFTKYNGKK